MRNTATVNYHIRSDEKQAFQFDADGIVGNLISPKLAPSTVSVQDLRDNSASVEFSKDGITFENHSSRVRSFDDAANWQTTYDEEIKDLLTSTIGAKEVLVFDHTVRIDDSQSDRKPARNVHNDYSEAAAKQRLVDLLGEQKADEYNNAHYGFINIWRPVENPILTSPLGFIRPSTMSANDSINIELIYPDRLGQILGIVFNERHEWIYMSRMTPDEIAIFNIYDNRDLPFLGHSALDMEPPENVTAPRKSIETRTLVRYS